MKKRIDIEKLLGWTFLQELPKAAPERHGVFAPHGAGSAWSGVTRSGELGMPVDEPDIRNRYGVTPDLTATGLPHPDAITTWEAVQALDVLMLDLPDGWAPVEDLDIPAAHMPGLMADVMGRATTFDASGRRTLRTPPRRLVEKHAILGGAPDWHCERPVAKFVSSRNGMPLWFRKRRVRLPDVEPPAYELVEVDGYDTKRKRPHVEAYRKTYLEPDPLPAIVARADYQAWRSALDILAEDLAGALACHEVAASARPWSPWIEGDSPGPRILPVVADTAQLHALAKRITAKRAMG